MTLLIQKFGGTSVGTIERIQAVAKIIESDYKKGNKIVAVVSAMSGETNRLIGLAQALQTTPNTREMDVLLSTGEQVTIALLAMALQNLGLKAKSYTGGQVKILTDHSHSKARIKHIDQEKLNTDLDAGYVCIIAGFQGVDKDNNITTLGRGGSDTTAVALAAVLKAKECQIFTDVNGVYTTDPKICNKAQRLDVLSFEEMLELASLGSKVLQIRAVEFAEKFNVPLRVLSSFKPDQGTLITTEENTVETPKISGIALNTNEAKITVQGVPDTPGIAAKILVPVSDNNIEIDVIVQNVGENNTTDFTFTVQRTDLKKTVKILEPIVHDLNAKNLFKDDGIVKVSLVGVAMRSHAGIASQMFSVLAREGINIQMITTSEIKISVIIEEQHAHTAVNALHEAFELDKKTTI